MLVAALVLTATVATSSGAYALTTPLEHRLYAGLVSEHRKRLLTEGDRDLAQHDLRRCTEAPPPPVVVDGFAIGTLVAWTAGTGAVLFLVGAVLGGLTR